MPGGLNKYTTTLLQQKVTENNEMTATVVTALTALVTPQDSQAASTAASEMYLSSLLPADMAPECPLFPALTQDNLPADNNQLTTCIQTARTADQLYSFLLSQLSSNQIFICQYCLYQISQRYPKKHLKIQKPRQQVSF